MPPAPPTRVPAPLPSGLLAGVAAGKPIVLFLDYDGTISEITPAVSEAYPIPGVREVVQRLAAHPDRCTVTIVSGRDIDRLCALFGTPEDVLMVGSHGLEVRERNGQRWLADDVAQALPEVKLVLRWLRENAPSDAGFLIEDKGLSVALHYRQADPTAATALIERLRLQVVGVGPHLRLGEGKMVVEALPRAAGKGYAVRFLVLKLPGSGQPIYFGDDLTDEDAFYALREDGITVRVGSDLRPSWAKFQVAAPRDVLAELTEIANMLEREQPA